jgi:uncharacterized protein
MKFWDASAVVPLVLPEEVSKDLEQRYSRDPTINVWCLTSVEVWSAACRLRRQGLLDSPGMRVARHRLSSLAETWVEIDDLAGVRSRAQRLLETHPLRAADSLQLAAALTLVSERPEHVSFVTLDGRLAEAAEKEGFRIEGVLPA